MKFNYLGIFQNLKFRILMEKILPIPPKLNFTPLMEHSKYLRLFWVKVAQAILTRSAGDHKDENFIFVFLFSKIQ